MEVRRFESYGGLEREALGLLQEHMAMACTEPHAVMLTGGQTPLGLYDHIRQRPFPIGPSLSILISDERYVSVESPESNYGKMVPMLEALGVPDDSIIRVHTELPMAEASERYGQELADFLKSGAITLGILGLGADGHVASLFDAEDLALGASRLAMSVRRENGPHRISVTRDLLLQVQRIVFLVAGPEKAAVVEKMRLYPAKVTAGRVLDGAQAVEIWYSKAMQQRSSREEQ